MNAYDDTLACFDHVIEWLMLDPNGEPITVGGKELIALRPPGQYRSKLLERVGRLRYHLDQLVRDGFQVPDDYLWRRFEDLMKDGCSFEISGRGYDADGQAKVRDIVKQARDDLARIWDGLAPPSTSERLSASTPASNLRKLAELIGTSPIEAVFDPYLDDKGLNNLTALGSLGTMFSPSLKLLTCTSALNATLSAMVFKELRCPQAQIRRMSAKEHRRFLLLQGGDSIILGFSLNKFEHNEAIRREREPEDRTLFDARWAEAGPV